MARKRKRAMKSSADEIRLPRGVTLTLVAQNGYRKRYRIKTTTSLGRVLAWFAESSGMDSKLVTLVYKGDTVDVSRTPEFYEMEDEEIAQSWRASKKTVFRQERHGDLSRTVRWWLMGILKDADTNVMGNSETEWHYLSWQSCSDLPQELIDKILGMAFISSVVARACSLVCHSFLPITRRFLFERLVLDGRTDVDSFLDVLRSNPSIYPCIRMVMVWAWGRNTATKQYHSVLSEVLNNIRACALKGELALEVVDCDIDGMEICDVPSMLTGFTRVVFKESSYQDDSVVKLLITATSTVDSRALPVHPIQNFIYSTEDSSSKLLNSRLFRTYLTPANTSCLTLDLTITQYFSDSDSTFQTTGCADWLSIFRECLSPMWGSYRAIIDRARFPGLQFLRLRFLWREPIEEEDLEWFFCKLSIKFEIDRPVMDIETYLGRESVRTQGVSYVAPSWRDTTGGASVDSGSAPVVLTLVAVAVTSEWFNRLSLGDYNEQFHVKHYYVASSSRDFFVAKLEGILV
ncbi:hypothetical protein ARMGADRAFT_1039683 [Armillaria gallica]|uniref:Rad60/SUMO-like domain-containing protein n=1 Tax=Armillaria gallica TaxID=47427 RepID=A0A2H3CRF2_ARMGA|nr:hypothetical protein ARMGADRAFT_1039683 [Armillaria gallica]